MIYPSVGQYTEAIKLAEQSPEDYFATLTTLRPVLDEDNNPVMSSGNFAVVFKMVDQNDGKFYALKCFTRDQEGRDESYRLIADELQDVSSDYLTKIQYLDKELFVDTNTDDNEFPVLLMDWVEGETLDKYVRKHIGDQYTLSMLAYKFSKLAMWLITQPFAHGDLKPDNILVRKDGSLILVDYDGMYVPAMKGQKSRELGSPDFRHPLRTEDDFDEHIDDFSLSTILLSLKAISLQPSLLDEYGAADRLLFSERDYRNISECKVLDALKELMDDSELVTLSSLFLIALAQNNLSQVSFRLFCLGKPKNEDYGEENISTEVTDGDIENGEEDEFGVVYSKDGKRLLICRNENIDNYIIKNGTKVICDNAFVECCNLLQISLPSSIVTIGNSAFEECHCLENIVIPNGVKNIGEKAFSWCESMESINIPNSVKSIGEFAFFNCLSLQSIIIPNCLTNISDGMFEGCAYLQHIKIPNTVTRIGRHTFSCNYSDANFGPHSSLVSIIIPDSVTFIEEYAFSGCLSLRAISIPSNITKIEKGVFLGCTSLESIVIRDGITYIGEDAFANCESMLNINIPNGVTKIENTTFMECLSLKKIVIPDSVTEIGDYVFCGCNSLQTIYFPNSISSIGDNIFYECDSLKSIFIPQGSRSKFEQLLPNYRNILKEMTP